MKTLLKTTAVALLVAVAGPAFAQATGSTTGNGTVNIIAPLTIQPVAGTSLDFGTVAKAAGSVTVSPFDGQRSGDSLPNVGSSLTKRQVFTITGDGNRAFTPTIGTLVFEGANAPTVVLSENNVRALTSGTASLGVGGTLTMSADTPPGVYSGTFSVSVSYN